MTDIKFLTVKAVARQLSCSPSYIYKLISENKLPHLREGRFYRVSEADLAKWIDDRRKDTQ